jgi:hypothetical protein
MSDDVRASCLLALCVAGIVMATSLPVALADPASPSQSSLPAPSARIAEAYGNLPLSFEGDTGQANKNVKFLARGSGYGLYLTGNEAALMLCKPFSYPARPDSRRSIRKPSVCDVVRMQLAGASLKSEPVGEEQLPGTVNYFIGSDPAKWQTSIPTFGKVRYPGIYPGIDVVYYGNQQQLEFDFVVAPHADPRAIRLRFSGPNRLHLATNGDLILSTAGGSLTFRKPSIYQSVDGRRVPGTGEFALLAKNRVGFRLGSYDRDRALVIDPVLVYSTFLGGSGNPNLALIGGNAYAIAVDAAGNAYVTGTTLSTNFPITPGAFQTTNQAAANSGGNVFVTKLNATGTELIYSTYLGGSNGDQGNAIVIDSGGDAYVAGWTYSTDFPVTQGAFQTSNKGAANGGNAFITELNASGTALVYSTYLGGSLNTSANAIALDAAGDAYVAGQTNSTDFPLTAGAFQAQNKAAANQTSNAFVTELNPAGSALVYSTYLGGSGAPVVAIGGCRSAQFVPTGEEDGADAIAVDAAGNAYVTGTAVSTDFPVTAGAYQTQNKAAANQITNAFVAKLNPTGTALVYSTYLGGSGNECPTAYPVTPYAGDASLALAVDGAGNAYVAGIAFSSDFPVTQGAFQTTNRFSYNISKNHGGPNAFITKLNPSGTALVYSTYLGGSGGFVDVTPDFYMFGGDQATGLAIDNSGNAYVTGSTASADFPVTQNAYQATNNYPVDTGYNAFLAELNPAGGALAYSTYLGGNGSNPNVESGESIVAIGDAANALALDGSGNVYVAGAAESANFPVTSGAFQTTIQARTNAFVAKLNMGPSFTITGAAVTINAGATTGNTSTITVTPADGFTGSVALTAAISSGPSGAQDPPAFSFGSTSPVDITGPSAGTATLTIATTAASGCAQAYQMQRGSPWYTGGAALACVLLFGIPVGRRSRRTVPGILLLLVALTLGLPSCGGSGTSTCNVPVTGTTPGIYTLTVTGTAGATTAPGTVTLTVQ